MRGARALVIGVLVGLGARAGATEPRLGRIARVEVPRSRMVVVPAGWFEMGFPGEDDDEKNDFTEACLAEFGLIGRLVCSEERWKDALDGGQVYLYAYEIDAYEVTTAEYRRCVAAGACDVAALLSGDLRYTVDDWPMVNVTWQDAVDYCGWAGKRLPSEAEWEKAARGGDGRRWPWGNHDRGDGSNHGRLEANGLQAPTSALQSSFSFVGDDSDGFAVVAPPGAVRWSESPYGAFDLAGNVSEWVADYYAGDGYVSLPAVDPVQNAPQPPEPDRVCRGGSWAEPKLFGRTYYRNSANPTHRSFDRGFRCARSLR